MTAQKPRPRQPKQLDAGIFQPEISSFRLHLAAEGKAAKTVRTYTEAVGWFAAAHLLRETDHLGWEEVGRQDVQKWIVRLLDRYSSSYASNQYRALQQFFKWLAAEEEIPDPMLRPPHVPDKPAPVFTAEDQAFADAVSIRVAVHPRGFSACPVRLRSRSGSVSRNRSTMPLTNAVELSFEAPGFHIYTGDTPGICG
jgi:integrase